MDHMRILRRAFDIVRSYRVLWIFGFLLALTTSRGGNSGSNSGFRGNNGDFNGQNPFPNFNWPDVPHGWQNGLLGLGIGLICLFIILAVIFTIVRYVSETSAIRMVDRYEASGEKLRFREGWRLGWNRSAFRMWLVDLLFGVGFLLVFIILGLIIAAPLLMWFTQNTVMKVIGTSITFSLGIVAILALIVTAAALSVLEKFFHRAIALEELGVFDSIRRGWQIVRGRIWDVVIMGLILFGIGLVFFILMIPVTLAVIAAAALLGGVPGLLAGVLTNLFVQGATPWMIGALIGLPLFFLILSLPLNFISGLLEAYSSSTWTLTYREVVAMETVEPAVI
jgi:hypothetical protein